MRSGRGAEHFRRRTELVLEHAPRFTDGGRHNGSAWAPAAPLRVLRA